jgi:hypothetical protein
MIVLRNNQALYCTDAVWIFLVLTAHMGLAEFLERAI